MRNDDWGSGYAKTSKILYEFFMIQLEKVNSNSPVPIRKKSLQILVTKIFKVYNNKALPIFIKIFTKQNLNCNLR